MDRLSSSASLGEALVIVCLISSIAVAVTLAVQVAFPFLAQLFSGAQQTAFLG